jgi:hypothetical protein
LRIVDCGLSIVRPPEAFGPGGRDCRLSIGDCGLPIADCRFDCRLPIVDSIADCRLPIADWPM